jgi:alpha-N-arabinofuranosidase
VRYWGVGNENWNCGGAFCPEDYAAEYKRFATYMRDFGGTKPFLIGCGPDGNDLDWTRRFFTKLGTRGLGLIHGYAAHYYCGTAGPSATEYDTNQWYELLDKAAAIEALIVQQRSLMDEFDPQRRVGLVIDEWGTWHFPTPGRNPAFLWQQNTMRDALVAAITLDTFNRHADKLVMANIAQAANVLQAMILTEEHRLVLTPSYHVFEMYQAHQGARAVRVTFEAPPVSYAAGDQRRQLPGLIGSASLKEGVLTLSVVNPHATLPADARVELRGEGASGEAQVRVLTHEDITAHNTFEDPAVVEPVQQRIQPTREWVNVFAAASVTVIRLRVR